MRIGYIEIDPYSPRYETVADGYEWSLWLDGRKIFSAHASTMRDAEQHVAETVRALKAERTVEELREAGVL